MLQVLRRAHRGRGGGGCLAGSGDTNGTEGQSAREQDEMTTFGTSLGVLFVGSFFVFCAFYLGPYPLRLVAS